jgi:hypothetical protein
MIAVCAAVAAPALSAQTQGYGWVLLLVASALAGFALVGGGLKGHDPLR